MYARAMGMSKCRAGQGEGDGKLPAGTGPEV
jgi:hypothetical protein